MRLSMMSCKKCNQKMGHDTTLNYYESHAEEFFDSTNMLAGIEPAHGELGGIPWFMKDIKYTTYI